MYKSISLFLSKFFQVKWMWRHLMIKINKPKIIYWKKWHKNFTHEMMDATAKLKSNISFWYDPHSLIFWNSLLSIIITAAYFQLKSLWEILQGWDFPKHISFFAYHVLSRLGGDLVYFEIIYLIWHKTEVGKAWSSLSYIELFWFTTHSFL